MKSQISVELIITFSFFILLLSILISTTFSKINEYREVEDRQEILDKCRNIGDFVAFNLSYKLNELNVSAVENYFNNSDYLIEWSDDYGLHQYGNPNISYSVYRVYIINDKIEKVRIGCK